ncbi:Cell division cycle-associated 7-like protein [Sesamum alatum]|uniref:Cell division cycle-associated 7-like protein n=1 Tax=Sesamum alatum TaxID=300844 RepID=A0AAE1XR80_9LAMI|nr:Cell division cycle-associated 7-like protein [Sesamum alatum]
MAVDAAVGNVIVSSPAKGDKSPGVGVVGGRTHDSGNGRTCHQCRQKIKDSVAACKNQRNSKPCTIKLCYRCLLNRYGEKVDEVAALGEWSCPKCRGICNCSVCMKRRGHQPTGILITTAKATGFSSVSEMLLKGADVVASFKKEVAFSPMKRGKENSFNGKVDANLTDSVDQNSKKVKGVLNGNLEDSTSSEVINQDPDKKERKQEGLEDIHDNGRNAGVCEKRPKKKKHDRLGEMSNSTNDKENLEETTVHGDEKKPKKSRRDELEENDDSNKKDLTLARGTSPRQLKVSDKMSNQEAVNNGSELVENAKGGITVTKLDRLGTFENDKGKEEEGSNAENAKTFLKHQTADIPLPVGTELTSVAGIDVRAEDVGNALQFLEFCSVFGKILDVRKGQPEYVLQDLLHGRTARRGKFSLTVQFHMHLLSVLQTEGDECATLSPTYGKNSWFNMLKKCLSGSQSVLKALGLDSLEKAADYETLDASEKLGVLNLLCDEVLRTEKVRNWIEDQNTELAEKVKEAKQNVLAAKDKEKSLKQKMKDDIAKAIIAKGGAPLSIAEHEAIVSNIKSEAAEAHAEVLESKSMLLNCNQTSEAVRIQPVFVGHGGHAYWKLNCSGKTDVLHQSVGKGDALTLDEKWFALDADGEEMIEKHISSLRGKRLRV